jgi:predicted HicB family RNase H-like nuclease
VLTRRYNKLVESSITSSGEELTEEDIEALADEAERGYDLGKSKRVMIGRPAHEAKAVSRRIDVRVDPDLAVALRARAHAERRSVSEIVRTALREYLDRAA